MSSVAEVRLWGRAIGAVALDDDSDVARFEYTPEFIRSGIEVAPLAMPLAARVYQFPALGRACFHGLPGLLADALPDRFGHALIDAWLAAQGRTSASFNAVERLCYTGQRGMGALEFVPAVGPKANAAAHIQVADMVELASAVLSQRDGLHASFAPGAEHDAMRDILRIGTSAGGARAKAIVAWNPATNEVRSGQVTAESGFEYWIIKFDGVHNNRDKELEDPFGFGAVEYAYALMAKAAGIHMSECRLLEEGGRRHFMTRRFDRTADGKKLHMQSLSAIAHYDFTLPGAYSYEQALGVIRKLGMPMDAVEEQFRRMLFNILARNQDDHVKNIAFLMDKTGRWSLTPAFDLTYAYNPHGRWTLSHQLTLNGKRTDFTMDDVNACARNASLQRGRAHAIFDQVQSAIGQWPDFAAQARVPDAMRDTITPTLLHELPRND